MKRIIASAGLVAVSTTGMQVAAQGLSPMEASKPWSITAALRGFYDDNNLALPSSSDPEESWGFELRPGVALNFPLDQGLIAAGYVYSMRYYDSREEDSADHAHEFTLKFAHRFNPRFSIDFDDSFVYSQEPGVIDEGAAVTAPVQGRTDSDAFRNRASLNFDARLTEVFGLGLGYQNNWYDYDQDGDYSRSALLDRFEHVFRIDAKWHARENTAALIGYNFGAFDYTGDEQINLAGNVSEDRNNTFHRLYVGVEHSISQQFKVSARIGGEYVDYDEIDEDNVAPYAETIGTYTYLPGSYFQWGMRHARNATDIAFSEDAEPTTDQESSTLFASVNHRITPRVTGSLTGQFQRSEFNNGGVDGEIDHMVLLGVNFEYRFNPNWSTEVGYNYDRLDSDLQDRSFSRNRIYVGVRATY